MRAKSTKGIVVISRKGKKRLQFDFYEEGVERLDYIKELVGASTRAEVFHNAMKLYDAYVHRKKDGFACKMERVSDDGTKEVVELLV